MTLQDLYDIEGALERAIEPILTAKSLTVVTPQSDPKLQSLRPRVELMARRGPGLGRWQVLDIGDGSGATWREQAWRVALMFSAITEAQIATHTAYRAAVLNAVYTVAAQINGAGLPYHKVQPQLRDEGASPLLKAADGYYRTDLNFSVDIAINGGAWTDLTL